MTPIRGDRRARGRRVLALAVVAIAAVLPACGDDDAGSAPTTSTTLADRPFTDDQSSDDPRNPRSDRYRAPDRNPNDDDSGGGPGAPPAPPL